MFGAGPGFPGAGNSYGYSSLSPEAQALASESVNLEQKAFTLAQDLRTRKDSIESSERDNITKQIRELVDQAFEKRHGIQQLEVAQLEQRLKKVKDALVRRRELRQRIIDKRVDDLISSDELRWDSTSVPMPGGYGAVTSDGGSTSPYYFSFGSGATDTGTAPATTTPATSAAGGDTGTSSGATTAAPGTTDSARPQP